MKMVSLKPNSQNGRFTFQRLITAVQELSLARDVQTVMQIVRNVARELTNADGATFVLRENNLCFYADENAITPLWKGQRFSINICVSGWSMLNRKPVVIEDIYSDERIPLDVYEPTFVKSLVVVPIRTSEPIGAIGNYWAKPHSPSEEEVNLLQALADSTAIALENINVYSDLKNTIEELDTFIYKSSHDMRSPIASILGLIEIAHTSTEDSETTKHYFGMVKQQTERLDSVLQKLIQTTKIRQGERKTDLINFPLVIQDILDSLHHMKGFGDIHFEQHISVSRNFYSDESIIVSLFQNLIDNAIKYKKDDFEDAYIKIEVIDENEGIKITISDNGIGIAENLQQDVFKMFFRGTEKATGNGLGLYTVQHSIKKLGGHIRLESKEALGTTFTVFLPNEKSGIKSSLQAS